jgi:hypothetical protein
MASGGRIPQMTAKDTRLTLRIHSVLKKELEGVANKESRSVAQVCEAFLQAGLSAYRKDGTKSIYRFLSRRIEED